MKKWLVVLVLLAGCGGSQLTEGQRLWCARNEDKMVDIALDLGIKPTEVLRSEVGDKTEFEQAFKAANEKPGRWPKYETVPYLQAVWFSQADYARVCEATIQSR